MIRVEIIDRELQEHIQSLPGDEMAVFVMADGRLRGALFHGTRFVNQMRAQHSLGILETMVLGQGCLCGALMIPLMKERGHIVWKYSVDGPAAGFSVEADSSGYVRGFLLTDRIPVEKPLENWDLAPFLGTGTMTITSIRAGEKVSHTGSVEVNHRNIAEDLAWYFSQSEQIQTAFNTGIQMDRQGRVIGAGALFLQVMPETGGTKVIGSQINSSADKNSDEELLTRVETLFRTAPSLGKWFSEKGTIDDIVYSLFHEFNPSIAVRRTIEFNCPCSQDSFLKYIRTLPASQLDDIRKNGPDPLEITCRNCGSVYHIPVLSI